MHPTTVEARSTTITTITPPLNTLRVLNTRPAHQAASLDDMIRAAGCIPISLPAFTIQAMPTDWLATLPDLATVQKAIFVSVNAVHYFFTGLQKQHIRWPSTIQTFAIGASTAQALAAQQVQDIQIPDRADSEHLLALPTLQTVAHESILLVAGEKGRPLLQTCLSDRRAIIHPIIVYMRQLPQKNLPFTHALWQDNGVDIIVMLSHEAIENVFGLFEEGARAWLLSKPWIVISPRLVDIARTYHVQTVILSEYADMISTLKRLVHDYGRNPC